MTEVHYEVFRQTKGSRSWDLVEAFDDREAATKRAKDLLAEKQAAAVRVVKETHKPDTGEYLNLVILEEGEVLQPRKKSNKLDELDSPAACFKPDDFYSYHARVTLTRVLGDWLARERLTVTELLHSAKVLEKFEAAGTTFQHVVQKIAVAQASDSEYPVQQIIKQLNDLSTAAINRVYKDEKRGLFPELNKGQFGPFAQKLGADPNGRYVVNGVLTKHLAAAKNWDEKLRRLLDLMGELPAEGPGRALLLACIDAIVSEMLNGSAALADLLGKSPDLGNALMNLVELFLGGKLTLPEGSAGGINELARFFAKDDLPESRTAIAKRIVTELKSLKRLCPSSLDDEFKMLRRLANQLVRGQGKYLSHEELIGAFTERSKRLVAQDPLMQFMASGKTPDEKVERLLIVEENIIGAENKRSLASVILPMVAANTFEAQLMPGAPALGRLKRAADLQLRVLRAGFQDVQKGKIAAALDAVALGIEDRAKLLASIEAKTPNNVERARAILKLCVANVFTRGELQAKAQRMLAAALAKPGFLAGYIGQVQSEAGADFNGEKAVAELTGQLTSAGIAPEELRRILAA
jgi:hypothetical protein